MEFVLTIDSLGQTRQHTFSRIADAIESAIINAWNTKHTTCYVGTSLDADADLFRISSDTDEVDTDEVARLVAENDHLDHLDPSDCVD